MIPSSSCSNEKLKKASGILFCNLPSNRLKMNGSKNIVVWIWRIAAADAQGLPICVLSLIFFKIFRIESQGQVAFF